MNEWKFDNEKLKKLRESKGSSQAEMAKIFGVYRPSYIRYENGNYEPRSRQLRKIAEYYDTPMEDFFKKVK